MSVILSSSFGASLVMLRCVVEPGKSRDQKFNLKNNMGNLAKSRSDIVSFGSVNRSIIVGALLILDGNPSYGLCHALLSLPRLFRWSGIMD